MKKVLTIFLLCSSTLANAEVLSVHCPIGCPGNPEKNDLLFGHLYAMSNNPETKFADWVAYEVNPVHYGTSPGRDWKPSPLFDESETLEEDDYKDAHKLIGADKGHLAPLAAFAGSRYWPELNHLGNITPQYSDLNQGAWKDLEDAVRDLATYEKPLFVITGTLYDREMPKLPRADEEHKIPSGYFKIVYTERGEGVAFVMNQELGRKADFCSQERPLKDAANLVSYSIPQLKQSKSLLKALGCKRS